MHIQTPLLESHALPARDGQSIWLKMEALQPPGSFKLRGVGHACERYAAQGARRFVSSSGGNAGIAAAYAGRKLGVPVLVVVPESSTERARDMIRREGAQLMVHGASFYEANLMARSLLTDTDAFIHPFDDPLLWDGHSTMIDEVAQAGLVPDAVVLSVGGGGMMLGVVQGLRRNGMGNVPVIAVETLGAESFAQAIRAGEPVELPSISSIATSLGARRVADAAFQVSREHDVRNAIVTDKAAVDACLRFIEDHRIVVEPACGASLAMVYGEHELLAGFRNVLVIVCGGVTASVTQLQAWSAALAR